MSLPSLIILTCMTIRRARVWNTAIANCSLKIAQTRQTGRLSGRERFVYIRKTAKELHHLEMPPSAEEIKLTEQYVLFFLCSYKILVNLVDSGFNLGIKFNL